MRRTIILVLAITLFAAGCEFIRFDPSYPHSEEEYLMSWTIFNLEDDVHLEMPENPAVYNYTFNYAAGAPTKYDDVMFWTAPWQFIGVAPNIPFPVPMTRVYYVHGDELTEQLAGKSWSYMHFIWTNYLRFEDETLEDVAGFMFSEWHKGNFVDAINPLPGDYQKIYFGTAPFLPTSVVYDNSIRLNDHLISGNGGRSYLEQVTERQIFLSDGTTTLLEFEMPVYRIYLNDTLIQEGDLVDEQKRWDYTRLAAFLPSGAYRVEVDIPNSYPLFNTSIVSEFTVQQLPLNLPILKMIEFPASYIPGTDYPVGVFFENDVEEVTLAYRRPLGDWIPVEDTVSLPDIPSVDLQITARTDDGTTTWTVTPASLRSVPVNCRIEQIGVGEVTIVHGTCSLNNAEGVGGLRLQIFAGDEFVGATKTDEDGAFDFSFDPSAFENADDVDDIRVVFEGTGVYSPTVSGFEPPIQLTTSNHRYMEPVTPGTDVFLFELINEGTEPLDLARTGLYIKANGERRGKIIPGEEQNQVLLGSGQKMTLIQRGTGSAPIFAPNDCGGEFTLGLYPLGAENDFDKYYLLEQVTLACHPNTGCRGDFGMPINDLYRRGTVTLDSDSHTDTCSGNSLAEYYCDVNTIGKNLFECELGCSDGACLTDTPEDLCGNNVCDKGETHGVLCDACQDSHFGCVQECNVDWGTCADDCQNVICQAHGDTWFVNQPEDVLELSENLDFRPNQETIGDIRRALDRSTLSALADNVFETGASVVGYGQQIMLDSGIVRYTESDDDVLSDFLYLRSGDRIASYELVFDGGAPSQIDSSRLVDFLDRTIDILGKQYQITDATVEGTTVQLTLVSDITVVLKDTDVTDKAASNVLVVDDENIADTGVVVHGELNGDIFELKFIMLEINADDDLYVPAGGVLTDQTREPQAFLGSWDIAYDGLSRSSFEIIGVERRNPDQYELSFSDGSGNHVSVPLAYNLGDEVKQGDSDDDLIFDQSQKISKNDYFIVSASNHERGEWPTFALRYKGADHENRNDPVMKFDLLAGEEIGTLERAHTLDPVTGLRKATLKIHGNTFDVFSAGDTTVNDFDVYIDLDGDGLLMNEDGEFDLSIELTPVVAINTHAGAEVSMLNAPDGMIVQVRTINANHYDDLSPTPARFSIVAENGTLQLQETGAHDFQRPDSSTGDERYAFTSYGAFMTLDDDLEIRYPFDQRVPVVKVTSNAVCEIGGGEGGAPAP